MLEWQNPKDIQHLLRSKLCGVSYQKAIIRSVICRIFPCAAESLDQLQTSWFLKENPRAVVSEPSSERSALHGCLMCHGFTIRGISSLCGPGNSFHSPLIISSIIEPRKATRFEYQEDHCTNIQPRLTLRVVFSACGTTSSCTTEQYSFTTTMAVLEIYIMTFSQCTCPSWNI